MLIFTRGLPASGKTSWAKQQAGFVRVNRDELRLMLHGRYLGTPGAEKQVTAIQDSGVESLLRMGAEVIVDDTNFMPFVITNWIRLANRVGVEIAVADFTKVPLEVCIERDSWRIFGDKVGEEVIRGMHNRYYPVAALPAWMPVVHVQEDW